MVDRLPDHDELSELLRQGSDQEVKEFLSLLHPADLADLVELSDGEARKRIFQLLDAEKASAALAVIEDHHREDVLEAIPRETLVKIVDEMESDDAADLLAKLPPPLAEHILEKIPDEDQARIEKLLKFPEDTAGGLMQSELVSITSDATVSQAIEKIRSLRDEVEDVHLVYITDRENHLEGVVDLKSLILADHQAPLREIMNREVTKCRVTDDVEDVAKLFMKYDIVSIPVVDETNHLVGRILFDDVMDVLEDEVDEDFLLMAGAGEEELADPAVSTSVKARLPWLMISWVGETITGLVIGHFSGTLEQMIILATFIPVIMALSGNVGTQSSTIMVRTIATSMVDVKRLVILLFKEIRVGLLLGVVIGVILVIYSLVRYEDQYLLGIVPGLSIIITMCLAAFIGAFVPRVLDAVGIDPAVATAPFITMTCDIIGVLVYLSIANIMVVYLR